MAIAARLKCYLEAHRVSYQLLSHPRTATLYDAAARLNVHPSMMVRSLVVSDHHRCYLVVLPLNRSLDLSALSRLLNKEVHVVPDATCDRYFPDCEPGATPPFGDPYGLDTLVDRALLKPNFVYFEPGSRTTFLQMTQEDFHYLTASATWGTLSQEADAESLEAIPTLSPAVRQHLVKLYLPDVEEIARRLQTAYRVPHLPSFAEEVWQYRLAPMNHLMSRLKKEQDCWVFVEAVRLHLDIAQDHPNLLALVGMLWSIAPAFHHMPDTAPLGKTQLCLHALASANWMARLAHNKTNGDPTAVMHWFAVGIFQHVGLFLIAHLFPPEYRLLNKMSLFNPNTSITVLEKRLLGLGHAQHFVARGHQEIGAWLLKHWGIDPILANAVGQHHQAGESEIACLVNHAFQLNRLGDGTPVMVERNLNTYGMTWQGFQENLRLWYLRHAPNLTKLVNKHISKSSCDAIPNSL